MSCAVKPDDEDCLLCGGCGEIEATTQKMERDTFGCPLCISSELRAEIDRLESTIGVWARARAAMNFVKINTTECASAFEALGSAETALAACAKEVRT